MSTIGERIKAKRKELGLTQAELGEKLNITDRAVSKWEQGEGNPDMSIIASLAKILGVSLDYLILGKEPEEKRFLCFSLSSSADKDIKKAGKTT